MSFVHRGGPTLDRLHAIGRAHVIEVALPLAATTRISEAADNVLDAFAASIVLDRGSGAGADMVAIEPIMPDWIIAIHGEGEDRFGAIGRGYPVSFATDPD